MSRNMIAANQAVFRSLDDYCANRGEEVANSNAPRWIATQKAERRFLKHAKLINVLRFTRRRGVCRFDLDDKSYFCSVGLEYVDSIADLEEVEVSGGILTAVLHELDILPRVSAITVRNIVEAEDKLSSPEYKGHHPESIASLYPPIKVYASKELPEAETWRVFFLICLSECRNGESWIDAKFANTLEGLAGLELLRLPYRTLCRSIFDVDPGAMFLALYRCIESLYAFSSATAVIRSLGLSHSWADVAVALEDSLNWHPREEVSLKELLKFAAERDLAQIFVALGEQIPSERTSPLSDLTAKRIYKLRNELVHFRLVYHNVDHSKIDWNRLCEASATMVCYIYHAVFPS